MRKKTNGSNDRYRVQVNDGNTIYYVSTTGRMLNSINGKKTIIGKFDERDGRLIDLDYNDISFFQRGDE